MSPKISPNKERITLTIGKSLLKWLDKKVAEKVFSNRSHGLEYLAREYAKQAYAESER